MVGSPGAALLIAQLAFWVLIALGISYGALSKKAAAVFRAVCDLVAGRARYRAGFHRVQGRRDDLALGVVFSVVLFILSDTTKLAQDV